MAYVDYGYYKYRFGGMAISFPEAFIGASLKAEAYINKITFGRITEVTDDIKNAVCAVCEVYAAYDGREGIAGENNDGYSVTYKDDRERQLYEAARTFLPSELLYRGLY